MKLVLASFLTAGLAATAAPASAQQYFSPYATPDARGQAYGAQYDYARVIRVDPVVGSGYAYGQGATQTRCYERPAYVGDDRYDGYDRGYSSGAYSTAGYPAGAYGQDRYRNDGYYDRGRGYDNRYGGSGSGATVATVVGGVIGAVIGSQVGGGSARYATSAIGSMVGGVAGREVYEQSRRQQVRGPGTVRVCDPVPADGRYYPANDRAVTAYDVTYEYAGRRYTTRTDHHPGDRIRVRVDVRPE